MKACDLLIRKYRQGVSDPDAIILLILAERPMLTLTEISDAVGFPSSTAHQSLTGLVARSLLSTHALPAGKTNGKFYHVTDAGRVAIANLLR